MSTNKNSCFKEIDQTGRLFSMETPKKQSTHRLHPTVQPMCWLHIQHKHASWFPQAFMVRNVGVNHPKSDALACMGPIRIYLFGTPSILALWVSMGLQRDFAHRMSTLTWIAPPADGASRNTALTCREPVGTMKWWMINRLHFRISTIINYVLESVTSVFTASVCKHSCCLLRFEGAKHWRVQTPEQEQKKRASKYGIVHHTIMYIYIWLISVSALEGSPLLVVNLSGSSLIRHWLPRAFFLWSPFFWILIPSLLFAEPTVFSHLVWG